MAYRRFNHVAVPYVTQNTIYHIAPLWGQVKSLCLSASYLCVKSVPKKNFKNRSGFCIFTVTKGIHHGKILHLLLLLLLKQNLPGHAVLS
jgi:hypothetical protein